MDMEDTQEGYGQEPSGTSDQDELGGEQGSDPQEGHSEGKETLSDLKAAVAKWEERYRNLEKEKGRLGTELGQWRKFDQVIAGDPVLHDHLSYIFELKRTGKLTPRQAAQQAQQAIQDSGGDELQSLKSQLNELNGWKTQQERTLQQQQQLMQIHNEWSAAEKKYPELKDDVELKELTEDIAIARPNMTIEQAAKRALDIVGKRVADAKKLTKEAKLAAQEEALESPKGTDVLNENDDWGDYQSEKFNKKLQAYLKEIGTA